MLILLAALAALAAEPSATPAAAPVAAPAAPASPATAAVVRAIEAKYHGVESLRARVVQVTHSEIYGDERQTGTMLVSRPDRLRWNFDDSGKLYVSDGQALWIYTPADKQALKFPSPAVQGASADLLLQSLDKLSERFVVSVVQTSELAGHVLSLAPKSGPLASGSSAGEGLFKELRLTVDPKLVVTNLRVVDPLGTTTDLQFTDVVLGGAVPDTEFQFTPPPGVDVVDAGS
jgi:outer membrane lipoprotein carrier protein